MSALIAPATLPVILPVSLQGLSTNPVKCTNDSSKVFIYCYGQYTFSLSKPFSSLPYFPSAFNTFRTNEPLTAKNLYTGDYVCASDLSRTCSTSDTFLVIAPIRVNFQPASALLPTDIQFDIKVQYPSSPKGEEDCPPAGESIDVLSSSSSADYTYTYDKFKGTLLAGATGATGPTSFTFTWTETPDKKITIEYTSAFELPLTLDVPSNSTQYKVILPATTSLIMGLSYEPTTDLWTNLTIGDQPRECNTSENTLAKEYKQSFKFTVNKQTQIKMSNADNFYIPDILVNTTNPKQNTIKLISCTDTSGGGITSAYWTFYTIQPAFDSNGQPVFDKNNKRVVEIIQLSTSSEFYTNIFQNNANGLNETVYAALIVTTNGNSGIRYNYHFSLNPPNFAKSVISSENLTLLLNQIRGDNGCPASNNFFQTGQEIKYILGLYAWLSPATSYNQIQSFDSVVGTVARSA